ncbi:MAG: hypothetical protein EA382_15675 [Spirochaetaceae bacterium]|nr:MAG: hypothetical protein EA382_15675 [Spirochaetaceae bacterium]
MAVRRVVMMTDMEGAAGVTSFEDQGHATGRYYEAARRIVTAEVNAAVEGLLDSGVEEILVIDGHGPGAIHFESLHPQARLMHGRPIALAAECAKILPGCDATCLVGQHARCGVADGTMNHTQSSATIEHYSLNGTEIGETAQWALFSGSFGVPTIFLSGDDAACREASDLIPGITTAAVKQGLSRSAAISLAAGKAHELIRSQIRAAVERHNREPIAPLVWPGPYVLEKRFLFTNAVDGYRGHRLLHRIVDARTVQLAADDIREIIYA